MISSTAITGNETGARLWHRIQRRAALPAYLLTLAGGTLALVAWMLLRHGHGLPGADASSYLPLSPRMVPRLFSIIRLSRINDAVY